MWVLSFPQMTSGWCIGRNLLAPSALANIHEENVMKRYAAIAAIPAICLGALVAGMANATVVTVDPIVGNGAIPAPTLSNGGVGFLYDTNVTGEPLPVLGASPNDWWLRSEIYDDSNVGNDIVYIGVRFNTALDWDLDLGATPFVTELDFNLIDGFSPNVSIAFSADATNKYGTPAATAEVKSVEVPGKSGAGITFSFELDLITSPSGRLQLPEYVFFSVLGNNPVSGPDLIPSAFLATSQKCNKQGDCSGPEYYSVAHLQGLGTDAQGSAWVGTSGDTNGTPVPNPGTLPLMALGTLLMGSLTRKHLSCV